MTRDFKKIWVGLVVVLLVGLILPPAGAQVAGSPSPTPTSQGKNRCELFLSVSAKIGQQVASYTNKLKDKRDEIATKLKERQTERVANKTEVRAKWDANRADHFAKLQELAQTDAQKQVILKFKQTVSAAIAAHRAAIDAANRTFEDAVKQANLSRKTSLDSAVTTFKNAVKAVYEKAQADCAAGTDTKTVRTNLKTALQSARDTLNASRQSIEAAKSMQSLIDAHKAAIKKANDDFKAAVAKALADFKTAMAALKPSPSASPSATPSATPSPSPSG